MPPFVFICWSETYELEDGDVIPLEEADPIFERLDRTRVKENKENDTGGYDKTKFVIYYQINGELSTYEGRQDFGDGDGSLIEHIEGFAKYYLETESGRQLLKDMGEESGRAMQEDCEYIRDELLPYLKYHCNLYAIEKALLEEQKAEEKIPVVTDRQEARKEYQRDMLAFIQESRLVLNQGGTLPVMPDIRDYEETKEKRAYREHVMKEIAEEAKGYGMTVEEYAKNGYEPKKR
nr:LPD25 domain-containing protein [Mediterraneibacter glycyrrhizinilyticus]